MQMWKATRPGMWWPCCLQLPASASLPGKLKSALITTLNASLMLSWMVWAVWTEGWDGRCQIEFQHGYHTSVNSGWRYGCWEGPTNTSTTFIKLTAMSLSLALLSMSTSTFGTKMLSKVALVTHHSFRHSSLLPVLDPNVRYSTIIKVALASSATNITLAKFARHQHPTLHLLLPQ